MRRTIAAFLLGFIAVVVMLAGCSWKSQGTIHGRIIGADTGKPLKGAQIILCRLSDESGGEETCALQAAPSTQADATGTFHLTSVPAGSYVLVYGFPGELQTTADQWAGVEVTNLSLKLAATGEFRSDPVGRFWNQGMKSATEGAQGEFITHGQAIWLNRGAVRSVRFGITITVEDRKLTPRLTVRNRETASVEWKAMSR